MQLLPVTSHYLYINYFHVLHFRFLQLVRHFPVLYFYVLNFQRPLVYSQHSIRKTDNVQARAYNIAHEAYSLL